jgi:MarR family transcriptional regulator for hemolysin
MEAAGLVTRTRNPENRRVHNVDLTAAGEAAFARLLDAVREFDRQLQKGFSKNEIEAVSGLLLRLQANAEAT